MFTDTNSLFFLNKHNNVSFVTFYTFNLFYFFISKYLFTQNIDMLCLLGCNHLVREPGTSVYHLHQSVLLFCSI